MNPPAEQTPPPLPRLARPVLIGGAITAAAYAVLALLSDWDAVAASAAAIPPGAIAAALLASTGNFVLRGIRWWLYLRRVAPGVPAVGGALVFLAGFSMSLTPGKVGELLKPALLRERYGAPVGPVSSAVVAERITDLLGVAALLGLGALAEPAFAPIAGVVWLGAAGATVALASPRLSGLAIALIRRLPAGEKIGGALEGLFASLQALCRPSILAPALLLSLGAWAAQCLSLYLVAAPMAGLSVDPLEAILAYVAPLLAGAGALVPGGVGVTEATMAGLLARLGEGTLADAAAATAVTRGVTLWWAVAVGSAALGAWWLGGRGRR